MNYDQQIFSTAIADGMPEPLAMFIVAQARHETGNYKHRFFTEGKNAFGYSYVKGAKWQLPTPGTKADNGLPIAQYATVENSVHELTDWIKRRQKEGKFPGNLTLIDTPEKYASLLKNAGYYGAPLQIYTNGLISWLKKILDEEILTKETGGTALIVILLLVIFRKRIFGK